MLAHFLGGLQLPPSVRMVGNLRRLGRGLQQEAAEEQSLGLGVLGRLQSSQIGGGV